MVQVACYGCKRVFFRHKNRVNENIKLGHQFYCSKDCEGAIKRRRVILKCENCNKEFERRQKIVSAFNYCSSSCAAIINNQKFPKRGCGFKICKICRAKFKGENKCCSEACWAESKKRHDPKDLIKTIRTISSALGRTPAKREMPELAEACRYAFGSWNNAIDAAHLKLNRSHDHRMYKRAITKAADGHVCDSISEAIIDNWFTDHGIEHQKDVPYPKSGHRADWVLSNGAYVEYFGLAKDSPRYDRGIKIKQDLCAQQGIRLIEIYPQDLYPKQNLEAKLKTENTKNLRPDK